MAWRSRREGERDQKTMSTGKGSVYLSCWRVMSSCSFVWILKRLTSIHFKKKRGNSQPCCPELVVLFCTWQLQSLPSLHFQAGSNLQAHGSSQPRREAVDIYLFQYVADSPSYTSRYCLNTTTCARLNFPFLPPQIQSLTNDCYRGTRQTRNAVCSELGPGRHVRVG